MTRCSARKLSKLAGQSTARHEFQSKMALARPAVNALISCHKWSQKESKQKKMGPKKAQIPSGQFFNKISLTLAMILQGEHTQIFMYFPIRNWTFVSNPEPPKGFQGKTDKKFGSILGAQKVGPICEGLDRFYLFYFFVSFLFPSVIDARESRARVQLDSAPVRVIPL